MRLDKWKLRSAILFIMFQLYQEWSAHEVNTIENSVCFWKLRWEILICTKKRRVEWNYGFSYNKGFSFVETAPKKKTESITPKINFLVNRNAQKLTKWFQYVYNFLKLFNIIGFFINILYQLVIKTQTGKLYQSTIRGPFKGSRTVHIPNSPICSKEHHWAEKWHLYPTDYNTHETNPLFLLREQQK